VITSVHAFANDPERGVFILAILIVAIGGALTLFAARADRLRSTSAFSMISRESALVMNNLLLVVAAFVVFVGTLWPLFAELTTGRKLSVGAPFFNTAFTPFMIILVMILPIGAMFPWKRAKIGQHIRPLGGALALSVALGAAVWALQTGGRMLAPVGVVLATWVVLGALTDLGVRANFKRNGMGGGIRRLGKLPLADWGKAVAHMGMGLTIFGIATVTAWELEDIRTADIGDTIPLGGYEFRLDGVKKENGKNYRAEIGVFTAFKNGKEVAKMFPEKRFYPVQQMTTTEAAIDISLARDLYLVLGDKQPNGSWAVRTYIKPFTNWIWIGSLVMALGGLLSMLARRYRVGVTARTPVPNAVAAE
jgi:cytochrome c-type biogenesis protein CcmF